MVTVGYALSGLIAFAIIFIGARFILSPQVAAEGYGVPSQSTTFSAYLAVKGVRDIVSGFNTILLMQEGSPRLLGKWIFIASLIAFGDMIIVLRAGGAKAVAFGIHGATVVFMLFTSAALFRQ